MSADNRPRPLDVNLVIGDRIRVRRQLLGLTQKELAERVRLAFQMVSKYENGDSTITVYRLLRFAEELQVPLDYFTKGIGPDCDMPDDMVALLADRENAELMKLFSDIEDDAVRASFFQMLRTYHEEKEGDLSGEKLSFNHI